MVAVTARCIHTTAMRIADPALIFIALRALARQGYIQELVLTATAVLTFPTDSFHHQPCSCVVSCQVRKRHVILLIFSICYLSLSLLCVLNFPTFSTAESNFHHSGHENGDSSEHRRHDELCH